jgi:acetate kinase
MNVIWVLNSGSSSLKFCFFKVNSDLSLLAEGRITGIGSKPEFYINDQLVQTFESTLDQEQALKNCMQWIQKNGTDWNIKAVGHRIVHGGEDFFAPSILTAAVLEQLKKYIPLAPLHQPHNLSAVKTLAEQFPNVLQIGCFDTGFHANHTRIFKEFALPQFVREKGIRRYGFHGLSYEWIAQWLQNNHPECAAGRVVAAHLGNGASLCAMKNGKSVDTTMGLTALDGLPMGTRCGSLDPGVILYFMRELNMNVDQIEQLLSFESGLKGLSGISNDVRTLLDSNEPNAQFALQYFAVMTAQHIARMAVAIGGIDSLVFTGGIGEHAELVRDMILKALEFFPKFQVFIVPANEERMIAQHCLKFI